MVTRIHQVDAFAEEAFRGNPAAVCILEAPAPAVWMQSLAAEMNLSETAFVVPHEESFGLRWFTPRAEVDLCGHATLAAAHVLWQTGRRRSWPIRFETRSGMLFAALEGELVRLDFPADPPRSTSMPPGLEDALGASPLWLGRGREYFVAELAGEQELRDLEPDFRRLREIVPVGICVTSLPDEGEWDFVSRFFAPAVGIDEDPVTGSAHCTLGPMWGERLGRHELAGFQASRRGGVVRVRNAGDGRVHLLGRAITVLDGTLRVPIPRPDEQEADYWGPDQVPGGRK